MCVQRRCWEVGLESLIWEKTASLLQLELFAKSQDRPAGLRVGPSIRQEVKSDRATSKISINSTFSINSFNSIPSITSFNQFLQSCKSSLTEQLLRSASIPHSRRFVQLCMTFLFRWLFGWLPSDGMYLWERFAFNTGLGFETRKVFQICDCFQIHKTLAVFKRGKLILSAQVDPHPDLKANLINHFKFCAWGGALKVHLKILFPFSLTVI